MGIDSMLKHRCTIQTFVESGTDGAGKPAGAWADTYTGVPCWFQGAGPGVESVSAREIVSADFKVYLRPGQAITERDRVSTVTTRAGVSLMAEVMQVISVRPVAGDHKVVYLEMVR